MWWLIFPALVVAFLAVVLIRAAAFKPKPTKQLERSELNIDGEHAIESLAKMVSCKTVSYYDESKIDQAEFEKFRQLLKTRYPEVHKAMTLERIGKTGLLYKLSGELHDQPTVLMAHYDVVPIVEEGWDKPAFEGLIEDGVLWGRGTLDTKITLCGVMEAAEHLFAKGYRPKQDLYFAFAGDEEISGETAPAMVAEFTRRGVTPALVVDEGGAVVENVFPGVSAPCALIGIAEKGFMNVTFSVESSGGHASTPPPHTPVGELAKVIADVENTPFPYRLTKPVAEMFDTLGRHSKFALKAIFANLWCFSPVLNAICKKGGGELNAMVRTTCAFTQMEGSTAPNVIPPSATVGANMRIICGETPETALAYLKKTVKNQRVTLQDFEAMPPARISRTDSEGWKKVTAAVAQTWPEALVSPYLMMACSDSRHYSVVSDGVYRFSAMALTKEERGTIHGHNERIPTFKILDTVKFYIRLLEQC